MQTLLRPLIWRGTPRVLSSAARPVLAPFRTVSALNFGRKSAHVNFLAKYNVGIRAYSNERSNNDDDNNDDKDKDKENKDKDKDEAGRDNTSTSNTAESEQLEATKVNPTAVVVQEAKLPSHVQILAYHRIYMPGQVTPFDPNAAMKDGDYIGLFLSKKNPVRPITSFLQDELDLLKEKENENENESENGSQKEKKGKGKAKGKEKEEEKKKEPEQAVEQIEEQIVTEKESTTTATTTKVGEEQDPEPYQDIYEKYLTEVEASVPVKKGKLGKKNVKASKKETAKSKKSSKAAQKQEKDEEEKEEETEEHATEEQEKLEAEKEKDTTEETEKEEGDKKKTTDESVPEEGKKDETGSQITSSSLATLELLRKKQTESGAMVDSTAVYDVGVLAQVDRQHPSGPRLRFLVPVRLSGGASRPGMGAKIEPHKIDPFDSHEIDEQLNRVKAVLSRAVELFPNQIVKNSVSEALLKQKDPNRFVFGLMAECSNYLAETQAVLSTSSVGRRLALALAVIEAETTIKQKQQEINKTLTDRTTKEQREFFLREQLKMVRKELGVERDEKEELLEKYRSRLTPAVPKEAMKVIEDELAKLQLLEPSSSEYSITRNYLDWLTILPWGVYSKENFNLAHARTVLKEDHYGLQDLKTRILEFIAVGHLKGTVQGKIICLVGPPGVGKTSIGKSIAKALDRKFYRFSVGGMHDISEIKGHRRTYVGAMPGKLLQCLKQVKTANPVVLIDEIDKLGKGRQGDPASALLEVLDPEQNATFMDHYLDVPVDLSKVLFVCTANVRDAIPKPLLDRMEVMYLSGYIPEEQVQIVKQYLIPAATKEAGLQAKQLDIKDTAVQALVKSYCREAGVRNLQKHVEKIARKVALMRVRGTKKTVVIDGDNISTFVGKPVFSSDRYYAQAPAGIVMGLAWTQLGGSALYVETVMDPLMSRPEMRITGQLGDVMKESTSIAYTYSKNHLEQVSPGNRFFEGASLHMHIPEGATPKDGPSAGVTMVTSLLSLALDTKVLNNLAMTGELTLTGKVLRIGGVREKCIAAKRAGVKTIILPEGNVKDWTDLPDNIKSGLKVHFADYYKDVFAVAFPNYKAPEAIDAVAVAKPTKATALKTTASTKKTKEVKVSKPATTKKPTTTKPTTKPTKKTITKKIIPKTKVKLAAKTKKIRA